MEALHSLRLVSRSLPRRLHSSLFLARPEVSPLCAALRMASSDGSAAGKGRKLRQRGAIGGVAPEQSSRPERSGSARASSEPRAASATGSSSTSSSQGESRRSGSTTEKLQTADIGSHMETLQTADIGSHMANIQKRSRQVFEDRDPQGVTGKFLSDKDWREATGHRVAARFRIRDPPPKPPRKEVAEGEESAEHTKEEQEERRDFLRKYAEKPYADFAGLRFPTLETAESYNYHEDKGLDRLVERSFPIQVPGYRRLDPYLREYIHFLHRLDPARFSVSRIAERYRLREPTVAKVVKEWSVNQYLTRSGLTSLAEKQATKESEILKKKEEMYAKWVGWDQLGDEEDGGSADDEEIGEFRGWRPTSDWVRKQKIEVEMMSAFPMMEKRSPMPKRVDVDMTVASSRSHKVINWIDPEDKVVF